MVNPYMACVQSRTFLTLAVKLTLFLEQSALFAEN